MAKQAKKNQPRSESTMESVTDQVAADQRAADRIAEKADKLLDRADRLREFMGLYGYRQSDVAKMLGVSRTMICQFLKNKYPGDVQKLVARAEELIDCVTGRDISSRSRDIPRSQNGTAKLTRNRPGVTELVLCHLASICKEAADVADDIVEDRVCPGDKPYDVEKRRPILQKRLVGLLGYIAGGYRDLFVSAVIARREQGKKKG